MYLESYSFKRLLHTHYLYHEYVRHPFSCFFMNHFLMIYIYLQDCYVINFHFKLTLMKNKEKRYSFWCYFYFLKDTRQQCQLILHLYASAQGWVEVGDPPTSRSNAPHAKSPAGKCALRMEGFKALCDFSNTITTLIAS